MRKSTIKLSFILSLLLTLALSSQAEAGFFSTIKHILVNLTSGSKKITTAEYEDDSASIPNEPRDIGKAPTTGDCTGEKPILSVLSNLEIIKKIASGSKCASFNWKDRDKAPVGYMEGMALVYARAVCKPNEIASSPKLGTVLKDALAYYGKEGSNRNTYALLIGMGIRESEARYCWGQDAHAPENRTGEKAEAGLFQSAYGAIGPWNAPDAEIALASLYKEYKEGKKKCFLETFSKNITCDANNWKNWGEGEGVNFQKLSKECPAFAAEFAAISIRINKNHYGTLEIGETQFSTECVSMLSEIETVVQSNPEICNDL